MAFFYEFFAGGGMVREALGPTWNCLLSNDFCQKKADAYIANWGDAELVVEDISKLKIPVAFPRADLAWASFPCQDLSLAGNGAGLSGEKSSAFWGFVKVMKRLRRRGDQPKLICVENVVGTLTSGDGKDFSLIFDALTSLGYLVGAVIIDSVHFVPQSRPRLFIIAALSEMELPAEITSGGPSAAWHPASILRAYNSLHEKQRHRWIWWNISEPNQPVPRLIDVVESDPVGVKWHEPDYTSKLIQFMDSNNRRKVMAAQASGKLNVGGVYIRTRKGMPRAEVRFDGIAGCLRTPSGGSSRQTLLFVQGEVIRSRLLSPREAARLMGLPDSYKLPERYNDAYHLAGDGVVVPVVQHLSRQVFEPIILANLADHNFQEVA